MPWESRVVGRCTGEATDDPGAAPGSDSVAGDVGAAEADGAAGRGGPHEGTSVLLGPQELVVEGAPGVACGGAQDGDAAVVVPGVRGGADTVGARPGDYCSESAAGASLWDLAPVAGGSTSNDTPVGSMK